MELLNHQRNLHQATEQIKPDNPPKPGKYACFLVLQHTNEPNTSAIRIPAVFHWRNGTADGSTDGIAPASHYDTPPLLKSQVSRHKKSPSIGADFKLEGTAGIEPTVARNDVHSSIHPHGRGGFFPQPRKPGVRTTTSSRRADKKSTPQKLRQALLTCVCCTCLSESSPPVMVIIYTTKGTFQGRDTKKAQPLAKSKGAPPQGVWDFFNQVAGAAYTKGTPEVVSGLHMKVSVTVMGSPFSPGVTVGPG